MVTGTERIECEVCHRLESRHRGFLHEFAPVTVSRAPYLCRVVAVTPSGRKALGDCTGRWPEPCREAWPVSAFAWCGACKRSTGVAS